VLAVEVVDDVLDELFMSAAPVEVVADVAAGVLEVVLAVDVVTPVVSVLDVVP
jgi:hypothetical protein